MTARLIHQRVEAQVSARPHARAVVHGDTVLTYAELNERANRLAHLLVNRGVTPGVVVGVHMERCLDLVVALLAVLKAGGAYLPLDPKYPPDRIAFMLDDCRVPVVISDGTAPFAKVAIDLTADATLVANQPPTNPACSVDPDQLAYVIYTSGSTGRPKGVLISHDHVTRLFTATEPWFQFDARDVFSFWHSYAFDVSVFEIWGALVHGASVVVVPEEARRSPDELLALLSAHRVTVLSQIPSNFRHVVAAATASTESIPLALRTIIFAGEAVDLRSLGPWFQRYGSSARLVNMYGTTETTVHATYRVIAPEDCRDPKSSPIGVPIPDLALHVLDPTLRPATNGDDGEIYIGGAGLAHGYHDRPGLTAGRFVPDPFSGQPGARMYKTGDLARRSEDGSFDYRGRNDAQVKIRGYRIETGEISATLCTYPGVREAVVVARDVDDGDRRLVAYVALSRPVTDDALRRFLGDKLPSYMVPAAFVVIDALPLTPSGKIDLNALPEPELASRSVSDLDAPQGETQLALAGLVAELLHVDRVGLRDDFLALGGHSLLAIKLVAKLRARFGVDVSLGRFLANPTVAWLVEELARQHDGDARITRPINAIPRDGVLPASRAQERMWLVERMLLPDDERPFNVAIAIAIGGELDAAVLARSFAEVIARHESLRTNFRLAGRKLSQVIAQPFAIELPVVERARAERDHELRVRARELARPAFDLAKGRLVRAELIRFAPHDHVLLVAVHHIVYDNSSLGVFVRELAALYEAFRAGQPSPLAALPVQLVDIAHWQLQISAQDEQSSLPWWIEHLANAPTTELPGDRPRPTRTSAAGARVELRVPRALAANTRAFARRESTTLFVTMMSAFAAQLVRTGQTDLVLGTVVSVRDRPELETALGMLLDVLALRIDAAGDPTFRELVQRVRQVVIDAFAHRVSFEQIVAALKRKPDPDRAPLFQLALNVNTLASPAAPTGQTWDVTIPDTGSVPYDLTIELTDTGDELEASFEYRTDLFAPATIERLAADFQAVLRRGIDDPDQPLSQLFVRLP